MAFSFGNAANTMGGGDASASATTGSDLQTIQTEVRFTS